MKLLAVDTSSSSCSVALLDGPRLLAETVYTAGKTHSVNLMSMIDWVIGQCGCPLHAIDGFSVARGPGTFTGLRIGISTVKGLCTATQAPIVAVSSLEALALPLSKARRPIVAMIDARRQEVYWSVFEAGDDGIETRTPVSVSAPEKVAAVLPAGAVLVGSGALVYRSVFESLGLKVQFADPTQHVIRGASVGMLALKRFMRQDTDAIDTLTPDYIRKSDAQIHKSGTY